MWTRLLRSLCLHCITQDAREAVDVSAPGVWALSVVSWLKDEQDTGCLGWECRLG